MSLSLFVKLLYWHKEYNGCKTLWHVIACQYWGIDHSTISLKDMGKKADNVQFEQMIGTKHFLHSSLSVIDVVVLYMPLQRGGLWVQQLYSLSWLTSYTVLTASQIRCYIDWRKPSKVGPSRPSWACSSSPNQTVSHHWDQNYWQMWVLLCDLVKSNISEFEFLQIIPVIN